MSPPPICENLLNLWTTAQRWEVEPRLEPRPKIARSFPSPFPCFLPLLPLYSLIPVNMPPSTAPKLAETQLRAGALFIAIALCFSGTSVLAQSAASASASTASVPKMVETYCLDCHNTTRKKGELDFSALNLKDPAQHSDVWEKVIRKMNVRQMPPVGKDRPSEAEYNAIVAGLEKSLDAAAAKKPNPGRTETFRRLTRIEYQNAVHDLLAVDIDASALLPKDESSHGFDNVTVGDLSPTLLDRYISAAQKISQLAVGAPRKKQGGDTIRLKADLTQEEQVEGLPPGTRGGALLDYTFLRDGEYEVQVRLTRDRNEEIEGLREPNELEILLDRERVKLFTVSPVGSSKNYETVDGNLKVRFPVTAGPHKLGVTFLKNPTELMETKRQPYQAHYNVHRHPRQTPAIYQISINGPYDSKSPGDSPSRRRIFIARPTKTEDEEACAKTILSSLMKRAYRRPVNEADLKKPMEFFREGRAEGFDSGIEMAVSAILMSPQFLFRVEQDPAKIAPHTAYRINDLNLATRLSFFLWSSIPDDELLDCAIKGDLHKPAVMEKQVLRMLADERSQSFVSNFAGQWLYLRNLESITPDLRLFPDFDDNLRQAFREETELFFGNVLHEDHSVLELLKADYTFLNERLAKHYGIPNVYGSRFRKVKLEENSHRGGLLRQGSILTVTSYATRTSPVVRGHWILGNLVGSPPPPPPANVPALKEKTVSDSLPMRERLSEHRANPACASCHNLMDPIGFSLENFDAIGRWRNVEDGRPLDVSGGLPDGSKFMGVGGLETGLLARPEIFVNTLSEKLLTYALGRGIEPSDAPAVRKIVRDAEARNFRFSSVIIGIVNSAPFSMRKSL
ncbi:MAG: Protein of unknown function (DUF1587)/Protein of unknown function (DUF1592)/Protein of unknown [Verrucomicrobiales bacterium]|nr:Protein of unknown function (DUF1587)/Protein of unknown function (DUF1592)/Protein of unknown [Verrucomicrobiales bacterium]